MAYNFTLRDDEDELTAPLLEDADIRVSALAQSADRGPAQSAQRSEPEPWTPQSQGMRDPALQQQWVDAERNMLERSQYNPREYGLGEALRDNGGMIVAGLFDAFANKGRGLPSLMAETNKVNSSYESQRREDAKTAGDFALRARAQKDSALQNELNIKRIQNEDRRLAQQDSRIDLANRGEGRRGEEFSRKFDPTNPAVVATKESIVKASGGKITMNDLAGLDDGGLKAMSHAYNLQYDSANTPQKAADEATIAGARANATNASEVNFAPALGVARGIGAAKAEEITRPGVVKTAGETRMATDTATNAVNAPKEERAAITAFNEKNAPKLKIAESLHAILDKVPEGGAAPGTGYGERLKSAVGAGSFNSKEAQEVEAALADIVIKASAADFGANSTAKQEAANLKRILGDSKASPEQRTAMMRKFLAEVEKDIAGASAANPKAASVVQAARGGQPGSGNNFGGGVKMRSPSGQVGIVPPDKIAKARAAGWMEE